MNTIRVSNWFPVEKFKVWETKDFNFYNEDETPFSAVKVEVGELISYTVYGGETITSRTPIIRWISLGDYNQMMKTSGVMIF